VEAVLGKIGVDSEAGGKNAEYDLKHTTPWYFTSEVKFDLYAARSGNIAIEFYNPKKGKPSGIGITKADLWFQVIPPLNVWVTTVKRLKQYLEEKKPHKIVSCGGDDNASLFLYRKEKIFADIFQRIDDKSPDILVSIIRELLEEAGVIKKGGS
jgi:hypothetical protein